MDGQNIKRLDHNGQINKGLLLSLMAFIFIIVSIFVINHKLEIETRDTGQVKQPQIKTGLLNSQRLEPVTKSKTRLSETPQVITDKTSLPTAVDRNPADIPESQKIIYEIPLDDVILDL